MSKKKKIKKSNLGNILFQIIKWSSFFILLTPIVVNGNYFFPFVGPKSLYFMALSEIIFFAWVALLFIRPSVRPRINLLLISLTVYLIVMILATIFGVNPSYSFWSKHERMTGLLMHFHLFAFFLVLSSTFQEEELRQIISTSTLVAVIAGSTGLLGLQNPATRGGGTLGNESFLGTYLLFNLFFALYLFFRENDFKKRSALIYFCYLLICLFLIGVNPVGKTFKEFVFAILYKEGARAAKLCAVGGLFLFLCLRLIFLPQKIYRMLGTFLLLGASILAGLFVFSFFLPNGLAKKIVFEEFPQAFGGRFLVWQGAIKSFLERPWLGWGPENFEYSYITKFHPCSFLTECGGDIWFDKAHNIIFDVLITTGIFGLLSYFFIFFSVFYLLLKNYLKKKTDHLPFCVFVSLFVAYFIQNLTVFDMISSYLVFFLSLAFVASLEKETSNSFEEREIPKPLLAIIFFVFLGSFTFFCYLPLLSSRNVILSIKVEPFSAEQLEFSQKALLLSPVGKFQIRQFFAEKATSNFATLKQTSPQIVKYLDFLVGELEKSVKECPFEYRSYLRLGELMNYYSQIDKEKIFEGEKFLRKAMEISPTNQQTYWVLAQNLYFQKRYEEMLDMAQKAVELEPRLLDSHLILIKAAKMSGNLDLAKKKIEEAIKINPAWEEELKKRLGET